MSSTPLIQAAGVNKVYKRGSQEIVALWDTDLSILPGEFVVILGPSGSGKSTLLHLLGAIDRPTRGRLLVNGVDWASYGSEITTDYTDKAFWGDYSINFWDHFSTPAGGYPATLPVPLGHGAVPPEVMGRYRNVIWVGNDYSGDLSSWMSSPVLSYLKSGGNVLLMTRMGDQFLGDSLRDYLGINFASGTTLYDCIATRPGLTDIARLGTQSNDVVFDTVRTRTDTQLL